MKLGEIVERLNLEVLVAGEDDREVRWAYASDLLSDAMASAEPHDLWLTIQRHMNIVAVGKLKDLSGIVLAKGIRPSDEVIAKAEEEGVAMFVSADALFLLCGRLYNVLKRRDSWLSGSRLIFICTLPFLLVGASICLLVL